MALRKTDQLQVYRDVKANIPVSMVAMRFGITEKKVAKIYSMFVAKETVNVKDSRAYERLTAYQNDGESIDDLQQRIQSHRRANSAFGGSKDIPRSY